MSTDSADYPGLEPGVVSITYSFWTSLALHAVYLLRAVLQNTNEAKKLAAGAGSSVPRIFGKFSVGGASSGDLADAEQLLRDAHYRFPYSKPVAVFKDAGGHYFVPVKVAGCDPYNNRTKHEAYFYGLVSLRQLVKVWHLTNHSAQDHRDWNIKNTTWPARVRLLQEWVGCQLAVLHLVTERGGDVMMCEKQGRCSIYVTMIDQIASQTMRLNKEWQKEREEKTRAAQSAAMDLTQPGEVVNLISDSEEDEDRTEEKKVADVTPSAEGMRWDPKTGTLTLTGDAVSCASDGDGYDDEEEKGKVVAMTMKKRWKTLPATDAAGRPQLLLPVPVTPLKPADKLSAISVMDDDDTVVEGHVDAPASSSSSSGGMDTSVAPYTETKVTTEELKEDMSAITAGNYQEVEGPDAVYARAAATPPTSPLKRDKGDPPTPYYASPPTSPVRARSPQPLGYVPPIPPMPLPAGVESPARRPPGVYRYAAIRPRDTPIKVKHQRVKRRTRQPAHARRLGFF